jgi:hypothetical protein
VSAEVELSEFGSDIDTDAEAGSEEETEAEPGSEAISGANFDLGIRRTGAGISTMLA